MTNLSIIVGLGNPEDKYERTLHNVGFWFVDALAARNNGQFRVEAKFHGLLCRLFIGGADLRLLKPATFMNRSGRAVGDLLDRHEIPFEKVLVVSDDFQLPLGRIRFRRKGSAGGHKGLGSIIRTLGTDRFPRLRVGIGPAPSMADVICVRTPRCGS